MVGMKQPATKVQKPGATGVNLPSLLRKSACERAGGDAFVSAVACRLGRKNESPSHAFICMGWIKGCLREPAGRLESHDKGPVGMGCQACQLPTPNEHLAQAGRTHSGSALPACDRESSRQLDSRRMWQPARRKALAWLRTVTTEINTKKKKRGRTKGKKKREEERGNM